MPAFRLFYIAGTKAVLVLEENRSENGVVQELPAYVLGEALLDLGERLFRDSDDEELPRAVAEGVEPGSLRSVQPERAVIFSGAGSRYSRMILPRLLL